MSMPSYAPEHQPLPQVRNLEIRGTWNGEFSGAAELRISLEVQGTPNTQLQLLNLSSAHVLLGKTSVQFQSEKWSQTSQPNDCTPRSPLFGFTEATFPNDEEAPMYSKSVPTAIRNTNGRSFSESHDETYASNFVLASDHDDKDPSRAEEHLPGVFSNFAKKCDQVSSPNLGKRSATEACLADSPLHAENDQPDRKRLPQDVICKPNTSEHDLDTPNGLARSEGDDTSNAMSRPRPDSPRGASKPILRLDTSVNIQQSSSPRTQFMQDVDRHPNDSKTTTVNSCYLQGGAQGDEKQSSTLTENPIGSGELASNGQHTAGDLIYLVSPDLSQDHTSNGIPTSSNLNKGLAGNLKTGMDDGFSTSPSSLPEMKQPAGQRPNSEEAHLIDHDDISELAPEHESCGVPADRPKLGVLEGILFVQNTANVRAGIYKLVITVSITLHREMPDGWCNLVIPGLPQMRAGESGFFLFLVPEKYGVEFRTTNLRRFKMIEDCLFADFVDKRDLEISMRSFDEKNYGIIKDFTVDQEIKASPLSSSFPDKGELLVRYYAMCSIRLHQRCFWAEKCCFFLKLYGGPEGYYQCKLQSPDTGLQMIHIPANVLTRTGVSHLQVICSSKDLEMFCITWLDKSHTTAKKWLPRIYSTSSSCERSRDQLQSMFASVFGNTVTEGISYQYNVPALECRIGQRPVETLFSCDQFESSGQPLLYQVMISQIKIVSEAFRTIGTSPTDLISTRMASRTQFLVLILGVASTVCGVLGYFMLSHAYSRAFDRPSEAPIELDHCSLGILRMNGRIPGCGEAGIECTLAKNLLKTIPETNRGPSLFNSSDTSNNIALDEPEACPSLKTDMAFEEQAVAEELKTRTVDESSEAMSPTSDRGTSWRDKIDYWFGWKGPINRMA
ncbi:hypothetical protein BBP40_000239 [Aspergillus hancockii]|nr:hypothetical protein BBP40_000239 [Aspergillus hancockii]